MKKLLFILVLMLAVVAVNAQKRVKFPAEELPKAISDNIAKEYPGFTVKQATWDFSSTLVPKNIYVYDIVITNGTNDMALLYNKDGKFLKKGVVMIEEEKKPERPERPARPSTQK